MNRQSGELKTLLKRLLHDVVLFTRYASQLKLRSYQVEAAQAIVASALAGRGDTIVVIFPRQSGKNELQAQVETYLLTLFSQLECELVKVSPTWKPQTLNAMRRNNSSMPSCPTFNCDSVMKACA